MMMTLYRVELPLAYPFTISRGTLTSQPSLYVELEHEGHTGLGEVTANTFYGHSLDSMTAALELARPELSRYVNAKPTDVWPDMAAIIGHDMFAISALDMAATDLWAKRNSQPTWKTWQLEWDSVVPSSYTLGIDSIETMIRKLDAHPGWPIYKIKLGTDRDLEMVRRLRQHTDAVFRVDANCGWTVDQAIEMSHALADLGVEFIEQPLPVAAETSEKQRLFENSALPIIADEDCLIFPDVAACVGKYHGINVKICKCGGLSPGLVMLRQARQLGLKTMLGCMVESSVAISSAAHLLPLLDYADLDGATLLGDEPATGLAMQNGHFARPKNPGSGAQLVRDRLGEFASRDA